MRNPYQNNPRINDEAVAVNVVFNSKVSGIRSLEDNGQLKPAADVVYGNNRWAPYREGQMVFRLKLPAHSYRAFGF